MRAVIAMCLFAACHNEPGDLTVSSAYTGPCSVHAWVDDLYTTGEGFELAAGESRSFPGLIAGLHSSSFRVLGKDACGRMCELFGAGGFEGGCDTYVAGGFPGAVSVVDEGACKVPRLSCATQETAADFDLAVAEDALTIKRGQTADLHVTIDRRGATGPIMVSATGLPSGTGANPITIPAGATTGTMTVVAGAQAVQATATITISGSPAGAMSHPSDTVTITFTGASGDVDTGFGTDGLARAALAGADVELRDGVMLPDDGFVAVGKTTGGWVIAKFLPDGGLDPGFGTGGIAQLAFAGTPYASRVVRQTDGKLLVVGRAGADFTIARLDGATGALDASFGTGGVAAIDVSGEDDEATGVALVASEARIVVAGTAGATDPDFAVVGLTASGQLDPAFGTGGKVRALSPSEDHLGAIAVDATDRIWVAGSRLTAPQGVPTELVMRRYSATGVLDAGFGSAGLATGSSTFGALRIGDLALTAAGAQYLHETGGEAVEQMTAAGVLDGSFGTNGTATLLVSAGYVHGVAVVPQGTIVVGTAFDAGGGVIFRVTPAGALDPTFGPAGTGRVGSIGFELQDVLVDSRGRYVVMGGAKRGNDTDETGYASRYLP